MEDNLLLELIELINNIYHSTQYDIVDKCMSLLGIRVSGFEESEFEFKTPFYIEAKDVYAKKVVEEVERRLNDDQKQVFYQSLAPTFIKFTSNEQLKQATVTNIIDNNKQFDYNGDIDKYVIKHLYYIEDDNYKLDFINKYEDKMDLCDIRIVLGTIKDDQTKIKYFDDLIEEPDELGKLLLTIGDDNLKLELYEKYKDVLDGELKYDDLVCSLKDDYLKLKTLERIKYSSKYVLHDQIIYALTNEESLISIWDKVDNEGKALIIYRIKNPEKRFELFKRLNRDLESVEKNKAIFQLVELVNELPQEYRKFIISECPNIRLGYTDLISIVTSLSDEEEIIGILKIRGAKHISHFVRKNQLLSPENMLQNVDLFLSLEQVENKEAIKEYINYLYPTNNDILYTIKWNILQPKYVDTLGLDKINVIGSFEELTGSLLDMDDKEYEVFYHVLNHYSKKEGITDWQYAAHQIMQEIYFNKIDKKDLCSYIDDINNVNMDNLLFILLNGDNFGVQSLDDINNYHNLVKDKCDNIMKNGSLSEKKDAIFIKYFGLSDYSNMLRGFRGQIKNGMGRIYNMYHYDIDLIESDDLKELFHFVETVINSESEEELISIYNDRKDFGYVDTYKLERLLKNEILKLYNKELLQLDGLKQNEEGLYEAGVDFSIIATSVGAYVRNNPKNYMVDWNKPSLASQHFCASFIRNDMLGTAPVPHFMYGFTSMEPYSLLLSGSTDIYSSGAAFISKAFNGEEYFGPDRQINETAYNKKFTYNEMDFRRIQNGEKKKPDYILVFRRDGVIPNLDEAKQASQEWNGLPIVVIDVNLCLEHEQGLVESMLKEYYQNPTIELYNKIKTKVMNNRVTEATFLENINLDELKEYLIDDTIKKTI